MIEVRRNGWCNHHHMCCLIGDSFEDNKQINEMSIPNNRIANADYSEESFAEISFHISGLSNYLV